MQISIEVFEILAACDGWHREHDWDIVDRVDRQIEEWDDEEESLVRLEIPNAWGWASKISKLGSFTVTYTEGFNFDQYDPESLTTGTDGMDVVWTVEGITVIDEDGDEMDAHELADYLPPAFSSIDYGMLEIDQVTDIDADEDSDMVITLEIDNAPSIRFSGQLVARTSSSDDPAMGGNYSGQTARWAVLALYKTKSGKFVCHQIGRTRWVGERDRYSGKVCDTLAEVKEFFGHRWLAKDLYDAAGIDDAIEV